MVAVNNNVVGTTEQPFERGMASDMAMPSMSEADMLTFIREKYDGQELFNALYISVADICQMVDVTPVSVTNKLRKYPRFKIGNSWYWKRTDDMMEFIQAWIKMRG
ncbi:hypothetical protein [Vibrio phage vB_VpaS_AL-2]|nr:hypothetical protein [Vibrio phage vB_VpS_BA3]UFK26930.1 hypothetical protein [Vibrio phage vB_VpaS_AL-2]